METRKIYVSGGSTYVISLPKKWVMTHGIKSGDSLVVTEQRGAILIEPGVRDAEPLVREVRLSDFNSKQSLENFIIALYLAGYNTLHVRLDRSDNLEYRQTIRHVMEHLIGIEIVEETDETMTLEIIVDHGRTPTVQLLRRMYVLTRSMLTDFIKAVVQEDIRLAEDIVAREREIDRMHFLVVRQLKSAVKYPQVAERLGIVQQDCLGYKVAVKVLERISDHVENISKNYVELIRQGGSVEQELIQMLEHIVWLVDLSVSALLSRDREKAEEVLEERQRAKKSEGRPPVERTSKLQHALLQQSIYDSLQRIAEYTEDIAEITINMSVESM
jgi:phosphate uptake regulator